MSNSVISVENLGKSYTIRHQNGERYTALRDVLANSVKSISVLLLGRTDSAFRTRTILGTLPVSFQRKQGE